MDTEFATTGFSFGGSAFMSTRVSPTGETILAMNHESGLDNAGGALYYQQRDDTLAEIA